MRIRWLFILALCVSACDSEPKKTVFFGPIMGTQYRITLISPFDEEKNQAIHASIVQRMHAINQEMSTYVPESALNQLSRLKEGERAYLSKDMQFVLSAAIKVNNLTQGAFDITVAPIVDLWGFGPTGKIEHFPSEQTLLKYRDSVGGNTFSIKNTRFEKTHSATRLDLSSIAKGFAVDAVADEIERAGIEDYLVDIGGELKARGVNAERQIWRIGIENPNPNEAIQSIVQLHNTALATSGDYLNYIEIDGKRVSHTIDPATLKPVTHNLASVTVANYSAMLSDAMATALLVMGPEKGYEFAERNAIAAYFIIRLEGNSYQVKYTPAFKRLFP